MVGFPLVGRGVGLSGGSGGRGVASGLDAVLAQPVGQRGRVAEAEQPGGASLVAGAVLHGLLQVVSRNLVDDAIEINALADVLGEHRVLARLGVRGRQQGVAGVVGVDEVAGGPDGGAAQGVQQLADVTGPGVGEQQAFGLDGEALGRPLSEMGRARWRSRG